jgi:hypothetical protein
MSKISVGDRIRWKPRGEKQGLVGHEGTILQLGQHKSWCWVEFDDGTEKDMNTCELEKIES